MTITIETGRQTIGAKRQLALCEWLRANGVDPNLVPDGKPIVVDEDEAVIRFKQLTVGPDGKTIIDPDNRNAVLTEDRTVPLLSPPPAG